MGMLDSTLERLIPLDASSSEGELGPVTALSGLPTAMFPPRVLAVDVETPSPIERVRLSPTRGGGGRTGLADPSVPVRVVGLSVTGLVT